MAKSTHVRSAGVGASDGAPISPEAVKAVQKLGINDPALARHTSRELTRQALAEARRRLRHDRRPRPHGAVHVPLDLAGKVHTLDPAGEDVADPVGSPQEVYTKTAEASAQIIEQRLQSPSMPDSGRSPRPSACSRDPKSPFCNG